MKNLLKTALVAMTSIAAFASVTAQSHLEDPRYGNTPDERNQNAKTLSFLKGEVDMKNWDLAAEYVKQLMDVAPTIPNLYLWGATTYKQKAARAKTLAEKKVFIDSVVLIYDRRAEYMAATTTGGLPQILKLKARDYITLNPMDRPGVRKFYKDAVDAAGVDVEPALVLEYFSQLVTDYRAVQIQSDELLAEYGRLSPIMEAAPEADNDGFQTLFAQSGAADCEILEELYTKQLAEQPDNVELLTKAYNMMSMIKCQSDFYISVAEKYYAAQPSTNVAIRLAAVFEDRGEYDRALKYLNEMLSTETEPMAKADLYVRIAASESGLKHSSATAQAARQAIALNPDNGLAHFFLADAYISGSAACSGFNRQAVYWLAYDELVRARDRLSGETAQLELVERSMANCRAGFPTLEEGFMYVDGYQDGKSYTVSCGWISGTTTIRSR